jgi:hypothetical protein
MRITTNPLAHLFLLFIVTITLTGCWHKKQTNPEVVNARQQIESDRNYVTTWVPRVKDILKGKETGQDYKKARDLYDHAMSENNGWVFSLKRGIEDNEDLEKSTVFKDKAKTAGDASKEFVEYGV